MKMSFACCEYSAQNLRLDVDPVPISFGHFFDIPIISNVFITIKMRCARTPSLSAEFSNADNFKSYSDISLSFDLIFL